MSTQKAAVITLKMCQSICSDIKCCKSRSLSLESVHGENDATSHMPTILIAAVLPNNSPRTHTWNHHGL